MCGCAKSLPKRRHSSAPRDSDNLSLLLVTFLLSDRETEAGSEMTAGEKIKIPKVLKGGEPNPRAPAPNQQLSAAQPTAQPDPAWCGGPGVPHPISQCGGSSSNPPQCHFLPLGCSSGTSEGTEQCGAASEGDAGAYRMMNFAWASLILLHFTLGKKAFLFFYFFLFAALGVVVMLRCCEGLKGFGGVFSATGGGAKAT